MQLLQKIRHTCQAQGKSLIIVIKAEREYTKYKIHNVILSLLIKCLWVLDFWLDKSIMKYDMKIILMLVSTSENSSPLDTIQLTQ